MSCYQELRNNTQSWVLWEMFLVVQKHFSCSRAQPLSVSARAVGIFRVFGGAPEYFKAGRCFTDVSNQYFNPTEEPHKPGTKEKRKKAASFQTVSQLHKVRASPSSRAMGEMCSQDPTGSPTSLPRLLAHCTSWGLKDQESS